MADFNNLKLTFRGVKALLEAQAGGTITLSKIGMGSGTTTSSIVELTSMVTPEVMLPISEKKIDGESSYITLIAKMTNKDVVEGFYWRETGLFFEDADGNDVLFAYACVEAEDKYDYVPAYSDHRYLKHVRITNIVSDSADINIKETDGLLYVDTLAFEEFKKEVDEKIDSLKGHESNKENPHGVTAKQVGLGNVPNVSTDNQTPTYTVASTLAKLTSGEKLSVAFGKIAKGISDLISHLADKENPHSVTKSQVGLGNVENKSSETIREEITKSNVTTALGFTPEASGTADSKVSAHNTSASAHNDIRNLIAGLTSRLNALADSDDTTLDQMSEIVAYIKANKSLIESITTSKVNVADIINNLTTNVTNKPLSSAQGVVIKGLIDALQNSLNSHTGNTSNPHKVTASQVGAVPTTRTINGKPLSGNITLTASDVGAASADIDEITVGTFGYSSDKTYFTSGSSSVSIKKCGKVVTISGYIYGINNGSTNDVEFTVGTVPSGFRPPSNVYGLAWYGGGSDSPKDSRGNAPFIINSSGVMTMTAMQTTYSGRRMHFTTTYIIS